jgi:hypothetical protein
MTEKQCYAMLAVLADPPLALCHTASYSGMKWFTLCNTATNSDNHQPTQKSLTTK